MPGCLVINFEAAHLVLGEDGQKAIIRMGCVSIAGFNMGFLAGIVQKTQRCCRLAEIPFKVIGRQIEGSANAGRNFLPSDFSTS